MLSFKKRVLALQIYKLLKEDGKLKLLPEINMKDPIDKFWV